MATKTEAKPINNMRFYDACKLVDPTALKEIKGGRLKGFTDINPQWRYEKMTEMFGPVGIGWYFEQTSANTLPLDNGQMMLFLSINLYIKDGDEWSKPIPGQGGDFIIKLEKGALYYNDEAYKMATTDALGTAMKLIGMAAEVYRGRQDTKYNHREYIENQQPQAQPKGSTKSPAEESFQSPPPQEPPIQDQTPPPAPPKKGFNVFGKSYVERDPKTKEVMLLTKNGDYKRLADIPVPLLAKTLLMENYEAGWVEIQQFLANAPTTVEQDPQEEQQA